MPYIAMDNLLFNMSCGNSAEIGKRIEENTTLKSRKENVLYFFQCIYLARSKRHKINKS